MVKNLRLMISKISLFAEFLFSVVAFTHQKLSERVKIINCYQSIIRVNKRVIMKQVTDKSNRDERKSVSQHTVHAAT